MSLRQDWRLELDGSLAESRKASLDTTLSTFYHRTVTLRSSATFLLLISCGCGPAQLSSHGGRHPEPPTKAQDCGLKPHLTVLRDLDFDHRIEDHEIAALIQPYTGIVSGAENYNYRGFSAHPLKGPQGLPFSTSIYFYTGPEGLSLAFFHDVEGLGSTENRTDVEVIVRDNQHQDQVLLSDEADEFKAIDADTRATYYRGQFHYKLTTDGAVVGPLLGANFELHFRMTAYGDLAQTTLYSSSNTPHTWATSPATLMEFKVKIQTVDACALGLPL